VYSKQKWRKKIFGGVKIVGSCSEIGTILTFYSNKTWENCMERKGKGREMEICKQRFVGVTSFFFILPE